MDADDLQYLRVLRHLRFPALKCCILTAGVLKMNKQEWSRWHTPHCAPQHYDMSFSIFHTSTSWHAAAWDKRATFSDTFDPAILLGKILILLLNFTPLLLVEVLEGNWVCRPEKHKRNIKWLLDLLGELGSSSPCRPSWGATPGHETCRSEAWQDRGLCWWSAK